jgi:hypothetical protein
LAQGLGPERVTESVQAPERVMEPVLVLVQVQVSEQVQVQVP